MRILSLIVALAAWAVFSANHAEARKGGFFSSIAGSAARSAAKGGTSTSTAPKNYDAETLRPDALEACVRQSRDLDERSESVDKERAAVDAEETRLDGRKAAIEKERAAAKTNAAIRRFNASIDAYNGELTAYREKVTAFNTSVQTHNGVIAEYRTRCASKRYYESDMSAVLLKIGAKPED